MTEMMTSAAAAAALAEAEERLADLVRGKVKAESRLRDLTRVRQELAAGLLDGSPADRKRLIEATEEFIRVEAEATNLGYGIVGATRLVDEARQLAGSEGIRLRCEDALQHTADWRYHGGRAATLFAEFIEAYDQAIAAANAIRRLKICRFPTIETLETGLALAIRGPLFKRHLHPEPSLVAPGSRRELSDVVALWGDQTEIALDRVLSGEAAPPVEPPMELPEREWIEGEQFLDPDPVDVAAE